MLCFNQQSNYVKGQGMYIYKVKNPHISLVYRRNNLCHCHKLPTRPIIHFFRGLKVFRAACLSNIFETSHSWLFFIRCFSDLISAFHSFLPFLFLAVRKKQWLIVSIRTTINPLTVPGHSLMEELKLPQNLGQRVSIPSKLHQTGDSEVTYL